MVILDTDRIKLSGLLEAFAVTFDCETTEILSTSRRAGLVHIRHMFYYCAVRCGYSKKATGRFCGKDHTTVMHGVKRAETVYMTKRPLELKCKRAIELAREIDRTRRESRLNELLGRKQSA